MEMHGTKLGNLIHYLLMVWSRDTSARFIIFSQVCAACMRVCVRMRMRVRACMLVLVRQSDRACVACACLRAELDRSTCTAGCSVMCSWSIVTYKFFSFCSFSFPKFWKLYGTYSQITTLKVFS